MSATDFVFPEGIELKAEGGIVVDDSEDTVTVAITFAENTGDEDLSYTVSIAEESEVVRGEDVTVVLKYE
ncbi:hypothetical protein PilKf_01200 [Pillotina sp. SPG140]